MASVTKRIGKTKTSYRIRVSLGTDQLGREIAKYKTWTPPKGIGKREEEKLLNVEMISFENKVLKGMSVQKILFRDVAELWLEQAEQNLKPKSVSWSRMILQEVNRKIGHVPVDKLKRQDIREYISYLEKPRKRNGREYYLSPQSIRGHFRVISQVLSFACCNDMIENNICIGKGIKLPSIKKKAVKCLTREDMHVIKKAIDEKAPLQYVALFNLLMGTGARIGELLGLRWSDIDFNRNTISINEASQYIEHRGILFSSPKTESSFRTIVIDPSITAALKKHHIEQMKLRLSLGEIWQCNPDDTSQVYCENHDKCQRKCTGYCEKLCKDHLVSNRVFTRANGAPMHPKTPYQFLKKFLAKYNLPETDIHTFRHTAVSQLWASGVPLTDIADFVGHANVSTTIAVYSHSMKENKDKLSSALMGAYDAL